jgi:hypothetical protein
MIILMLFNYNFSIYDPGYGIKIKNKKVEDKL